MESGIALVGAVAMAASPIGLLIAGPLADAISVQAWYLVAGAATLIMAAAMVLVPAVMQIEQHGKAPVESTS